MRVGIPCPSDRPDMASVARGIEVLESLDCEVVLGPELKSRPPRSSPYLRVNERGDELVAMLRDPTLDVIWFADGGMGAYGLLPRLEQFYADQMQEKVPPTPLVGFSDSTFLLWQAVKWGRPAYYGPTVACVSDEEAKDLEQALCIFQHRSSVSSIREYADVVRPGEVKGPLLAGNFAVVSQLLGTPYCPPLAGAILLLEEHGWNTPGEHEYLFWFLMQRIELARELDAVAGIAFGEVEVEGPGVEDIDGPAMPFPDIFTIMEHSLPPTCPVVGGVPWGRSKLGVLVPLGVPATLTIGDGEVAVEW